MIAQSDLMTAAVDALRRALSESNSEAGGRGDGVAKSLDDAEKALQRHATELAADPEPAHVADRSLLPSPGVERRSENVRDRATELLKKVRDLRSEVAAGRFNASGGAAGELADRVQSLILSFERQEQKEIDLVQESVTPDLGAGD